MFQIFLFYKKCLPLYEKKNLLVNIVETKLQKKPSRYKTRGSIGTIYCQFEFIYLFTQCHNFSTLSHVDLSYHIAKKHSPLQ